MRPQRRSAAARRNAAAAALPPVAVAQPGPDTARRLQVLAYELTVAEARERQRIAQGLHDDLGQLLAMLQFKLSALSQGLPPGDAAAPFEELRQLACQAAQATRRVTYELHSPLLRQLGLDAAVLSLAQQVQRGSAMRVQVAGALGMLPLPEALQSVLLRVLRELAHNALKHAAARQLQITLARSAEALRIDVADDGVGFDTGTLARRVTPEGGFGLVSVEAQMQAIGGRFVLVSAPGRGTCATLLLGLADGAPAQTAARNTGPAGGSAA